MTIAGKYRFRALANEQRAREAIEPFAKAEWTELAIEWHALAARTEVSPDKDLVWNE